MKILPSEHRPCPRTSEQSRLLIVLSVILVFFGVITQNRDVLLIAVLIDSFLLAGFLLVPARYCQYLSVTRDVDTEALEDRYRVNIKISLQNSGTHRVFLIIEDRSPFLPLKGETRISLCLPAGTMEDFSYTFECSRASYRWEDISVRITDPMGLFAEHFALPAPDELMLFPIFTKEKPFNPAHILTLSSPGNILSGKAGSGMDFLGIREYQSGDSLRKLDWRQTARHPHRYYTREFEEEKNGDFHIVLDAREELQLARGDLHLFEEMVKAAASLTEMLIKQGNRVSLSIAGSSTDTVFPGYGREQLYRILKALAGVKPGYSSSGLEGIKTGRLSTRAIFLIISPYTHDDVYFYQSLKSRRYPVFLLCPEIWDFLEGKSKNTPSQAFRFFRIERQARLDYLSHLAVKVIPWSIQSSPIPRIRKAFVTFRTPIKNHA